tara:strand:- start:349 stop:501 length:153 start_codon:yes stop_codon:yes gene_type:complete
MEEDIISDDKWYCDECGFEFVSRVSQVHHSPINEDVIVCPECWITIKENK